MKNRTGWQYAAAGLTIASIAAVVSYNDGLFVARLAGNHDHQAYLYPFLPDGLFVIGLLALVEGARMTPAARSRWAMTAVLLGIMLSTAMNVGAGYAHSLLDAFLDGMVPVVLLIAVEVVLWHVRRGRGTSEGVAGERSEQGVSSGSPAAMPVTRRVTLPTVREIQGRQDCSPRTAQKIRAELKRFTTMSPVRSHHVAGDSGRDVHPPSVPAALNGRGHG